MNGWVLFFSLVSLGFFIRSAVHNLNPDRDRVGVSLREKYGM